MLAWSRALTSVMKGVGGCLLINWMKSFEVDGRIRGSDLLSLDYGAIHGVW